MQAGTEAAIAISNAQNAFSASSDKLFDDHLNPTITGSLDQIQGLVNDVSHNAFQTVQEATSKAQQISDSLPFRNGEPQLTDITPKFVAPSTTTFPVVVRAAGNFVNIGEPGYEPVLTVNGKDYVGATSTQNLQFNVPVSALFPSASAQGATSFDTASVKLSVPWERSEFLGLFHSKEIDTFTVYIGALPPSPGQLTLDQTVMVDVPESKGIVGDQGRVSSQSAEGNNDQIDKPAQVVPDSGWTIRPGSCQLNASAHGTYSISGPSYTGNRCVWSLTTIHKTWGSSGIIDFRATAIEDTTVSTPSPTSIPFVLNWGDSKSFNVVSGTWTLVLDSFDGKHAEFNTSDQSNSFVTVIAQTNQILVKAADPSTLVWP